ncbi:hypothetical protein CYMTET_31289 [Cymbomonas tetramitiformis]|uniref:Uncharacterized protein n=1 Tax=Cymbomonas tetramitiformis TaxID=36881 RepID=A0AAE0KT08_9CHLO|nr:hypothetical protein CYMTET_31289 [Cymbomonas tetramitiformis]
MVMAAALDHERLLVLGDADELTDGLGTTRVRHVLHHLVTGINVAGSAELVSMDSSDLPVHPAETPHTPLVRLIASIAEQMHGNLLLLLRQNVDLSPVSSTFIVIGLENRSGLRECRSRGIDRACLWRRYAHASALPEQWWYTSWEPHTRHRYDSQSIFSATNPASLSHAAPTCKVTETTLANVDKALRSLCAARGFYPQQARALMITSHMLPTLTKLNVEPAAPIATVPQCATEFTAYSPLKRRLRKSKEIIEMMFTDSTQAGHLVKMLKIDAAFSPYSWISRGEPEADHVQSKVGRIAAVEFLRGAQRCFRRRQWIKANVGEKVVDEDEEVDAALGGSMGWRALCTRQLSFELAWGVAGIFIRWMLGGWWVDKWVDLGGYWVDNLGGCGWTERTAG